MSNLYRLPSPQVALVHIGFYRSCPQCGAVPVRCSYCGKTTTDIELRDSTPEPFHCTAPGSTPNGYYGHPSEREVRERGPALLTFCLGTSATHLCSPQRRVRYGFLWLRKCREPGVHAHQKCERCLWTGIAAPDGAS